MKKLLSRITHAVLYTVITLIISAAILSSLARAITPYLNTHKAALATWISQLLGPNVTLDSLEITWQGLSPKLQLHNVSLHSHNTLLVHVNTVNIGANIIQSLWKWEFEPGTIALSGTKLTLWQQPDGSISTTATATKQSSPQFNWVIDWLTSQHRIALNNVQLNLHLHDKRTVILDNLHVQLTNRLDQHHISGGFILQQPNYSPGQIYFTMQLVDDLSKAGLRSIHSLSDLFAHITSKSYIVAKKLQLSPWLSQKTVRNWQLTQGTSNVELWLDWDGKKQAILANANVNLTAMQLKNNKTKQLYQQPYLAGILKLSINPEHWQLSANQIRFNNSKSATTHDVSIDGVMQAGHLSNIKTIWLSDLHLSILNSLIKLQILTENDITIPITKHKLSGQLHNIYFHLNTDKNGPKWLLLADFDQLYMQAWQQIPGIQRFSGQLQITPYHGFITLDSQHAHIDYPTLFSKQFDLNQLQAEIMWAVSQQGWFVDIQHIHAENPIFTLYGNTHAFIPSATQPINLDMALHFDINQLDSLSTIYPDKIAPKGLTSWLTDNLLSGDQLSGNVLLRGPITAFPFAKQQGIFQVNATAKHLNFTPTTDWPVVQNVDATFDIHQAHFQFNVSKATLYKNVISDVQGDITAIDQETPLIIKGKTQGDLQDVQRYLLATPLANQLPLLKLTQGSGEVTSRIRLQIPLDDVTPYNTQTYMSLDNATLTLPYGLPPLTRIKGNILINDDIITADDISAKWLNNLSKITINTRKQKQFNLIDVELSGKLSSDILQQHLSKTWHDYFDGSSEFTLHFQHSTDPKQPLHTTVKTDLRGMQINVPPPFSKTKSQTMYSALALSFLQDRLQQLSFNYGSELAGFIKFKPDSTAIQAGHFVFGKQTATPPTIDGITLSGHLPHLDADKWLSTYAKRTLPLTDDNTPSALSNLLTQLHRIDISFDTVNVFDQILSPMKLGATLNQQNTQLQLNSPQLRGNLTVPIDLSKQPISGTLDHVKLILPKQDQQQTNISSIKPATLPALDLTIHKLVINNDDIGALVLNTQPIKNGIGINNINLVNRYFKLAAKGNWLQTENGDSSQLNGSISTKHLNRLLAYWNKVHDIKGTTGNINFDVAWPDDLFKFKLANTTGTANITLGEGRIVNIGANDTSQQMNLGRLLNVFNLSSLSRRLKLDFSDITKKGYSFDSVEGNFALDNGKATTRDTIVKGSIADLQLAGTINLQNKVYDLLLTVIPHLTSSLPVIATVAGTAALGPLGAVVGAATWLVDKAIINPSLGKLTSYTYHITGPWEKPKMTAITKKPSQQSTQ